MWVDFSGSQIILPIKAITQGSIPSHNLRMSEVFYNRNYKTLLTWLIKQFSAYLNISNPDYTSPIYI